MQSSAVDGRLATLSPLPNNLIVRRLGDTALEIDQTFTWWSKHISTEPHMVHESADGLKHSLATVVAYDQQEIVAAAGIFPARTRSGESLFHGGKQVVELGSNVVLAEYRHQGIGTHLIRERLEIARTNDSWLPVSVTTNPTIHSLFRKLAGQPMRNDSDLDGIREALCFCPVISADCLVCSLHPEAAWYFPSGGPH